jgi:hypothetical protein
MSSIVPMSLFPDPLPPKNALVLAVRQQVLVLRSEPRTPG